MHQLIRNGLSSALAILLVGAMTSVHADQGSNLVKARFGGMHRGPVPKEDRQQSLGDIRTLVIRTDEEFAQFKQGIPAKAVGMYNESSRPLNNDPLRDEQINFSENILVVALRNMVHCVAVPIDSAYKEGSTLVVKLLTAKAVDRGACQSDGSDTYSAAVIQAAGLNVEFKKSS